MHNVLVIDNDNDFRQMLCDYLTRHGFEVNSAASAQAARQLWRTKPYDLVITDIIMPDTDGFEVIIDVRQELPEAGIIAITGGGRLGPEYFLPIAQALGADRAFTKPFHMEDFVNAVKELVVS
jgi:DNA-binding response OmpR family regulator